MNRWCFEILRREKSFLAVNENEQNAIVAQALAYGEKAAAALYQEYNNVDKHNVAQMTSMLGARLQSTDRCLVPGRLAEYDEANHEIICYSKEIRRVETDLNVAYYFDSFDLLTLCVWHELFHHLETVRFGKTSDYVYINKRWLGFFNHRVSVIGSREIAANSFVKKVLALRFYPAEIIRDSGIK